MDVGRPAQQSRSPDAVVVACTHELPDDGIKAAQIEGVELIVVRHADTISIFQGRCPHQGTLLSEGILKDGILTCRAHGWQFACASGCRVGEGSAQLKKFNAIVVDHEVKVDPGEVLAWSARQQPDLSERVSRSHPSQVRSLAQLPGPKGIPLLGNALQVPPSRAHLVLEHSP